MASRRSAVNLPDNIPTISAQGAGSAPLIADSDEMKALRESPELVQLVQNLQESDPEAFQELLADLQKGEQGAGFDALISALKTGGGTNNAYGSENSNGASLGLPGGSVLRGGNVVPKRAGVEVKPEAVFVVKTKVMESGGGLAAGTKVFLNVCQSPLIGIPAPKKMLGDSGEEIEGTNMPISIGEKRAHTDKAGGEATVYDVIFNPKVISDAMEDKSGSQRDALCQMALTSVGSKYELQLDMRYKLPKMVIEPDKQTVRDTRLEPKIEHISSSTTTQDDTKNVVSFGKESSLEKVPRTVLGWKVLARWESLERVQDVTKLELEDSIMQSIEEWPDELTVVITNLAPSICTSNDSLQGVVLKVGPYEVSVQIPDHTSVSVSLPYMVHTDGVEAVVNPHEKSLLVTVQVDKTEFDKLDSSPDPGTQPWLLAYALQGTNDELNKKPEKVVASNPSHPDDPEELPEDRFHLKLPKGYNKYTGQKEEESTGSIPGETSIKNIKNVDNKWVNSTQDEQEEILPEDKFHKRDMVSQHLIKSRENDRREKVDRADREREERLAGKKDDGIEYVNLDDFRPGGIHHASTTSTTTTHPEDVNLQPKNVNLHHGGQEGGAENGSVVDVSVREASRKLQESSAPGQMKLSSNLWSELLD